LGEVLDTTLLRHVNRTHNVFKFNIMFVTSSGFRGTRKLYREAYFLTIFKHENLLRLYTRMLR